MLGASVVQTSGWGNLWIVFGLPVAGAPELVLGWHGESGKCSLQIACPTITKQSIKKINLGLKDNS